MSSPEADMILLDFRKSEDFGAWRLRNSINLPLETLSSDTCSPFEDSSTLEKQWLELDSLFRDDSARNPLKNDKLTANQQVLVVCYDGDTSRMATSVLRAKNVEAFSVRDGVRGMLLCWPELQNTWTKERFEADSGVTLVEIGNFAWYKKSRDV